MSKLARDLVLGMVEDGMNYPTSQEDGVSDGSTSLVA